MTKETIKKQILKIQANVEKAVDRIEALADKNNINVRMDTTNEIQRRINQKFITNKRITWGYGRNIESIVDEIKTYQDNEKSFLLDDLRIISINPKNNTIKTTTDFYDFQRALAKAEIIDKNYSYQETKNLLVTEQANGKNVYKFNNEQFAKIEKLYNYKNPETKKILKAITNDDRKEFQTKLKDKYYNRYNMIWTIINRVFGEDHKRIFYNAQLILDNLKGNLK